MPVAPPRLGRRLEHFYPESAARQGQFGSALLRVRILNTGHVEILSTIRATDRSFANACAAMLSDTIWQPALDLNDRPVAHDVTYACEWSEGEMTCPFCARHEDPEEGL